MKREYGFEGYGCGLCQTGVPCESGIPERLGPRAKVLALGGRSCARASSSLVPPDP